MIPCGSLRGVSLRRRGRLLPPAASIGVRLLRAGLLLSCLLLPRLSHGAEPDADARGRRLFEQAAAWVAAGRTAQSELRDVYADLQDVKVMDGGTRHEGHMRIWLQQPGRLRWELRPKKHEPPLVKLLDGDRMWLREADSEKPGYRRIHGSPAGAAAVAQLKKDRERFLHLTRFLTLGGLGGADVRFVDQGLFVRPPGHHLAGRWLKVRRIPRKGGSMAFLFAFQTDARGRRRATWPAGALLPADAKVGLPTEHYVLQGWRLVRGRPLPARIERWTARPSGKGFDRTLFAWLADLRVNAGMRAERFRPPAAPKPPGK